MPDNRPQKNHEHEAQNKATIQEQLRTLNLQEVLNRQKEAVSARQLSLTNAQNTELQKLKNDHQQLSFYLRQQDLTHERTESQSAGLDAVERHWRIQQEQLQTRQKLERDVLAAQAMAVVDIEIQQRLRMQLIEMHQEQMKENGLLNRDIEQVLSVTRQRLEERCRNELGGLEANFQEQNRTLQAYHDKVDMQMKRDNRSLVDALEQFRASENQKPLVEMLNRHEAKMTEFEQVVKKSLEDQQAKIVDQAKATAQFGDIEVYRWQLRAVWEGEQRKSEHEHIQAFINQVLQTRDPLTRKSPVDRATYRNEVTITIPRDMAVEKTRMDMDLKKKLEKAMETGAITDELRQQTSIEAAIDHMIQARDRVMQARLKEGRAVDDLAAITDSKIREAAHLQQSEMFQVGKSQDYAMARQADKNEFDHLLENFFDPLIAGAYQNVEEAKRKQADEIRMQNEETWRKLNEPNV